MPLALRQTASHPALIILCLAFLTLCFQTNVAAQQCPVNQPPQSAPSGFTATAGKAKITFNWSAVACATFYEVYRLSGPNGSIDGSSSTTGTSLVLNAPGVYNGNTYYFYVNAKNSSGGGPVSQTVSATLSLDAPSLTATPGKAKITVSWGAIPDADSYKVCWANANTPTDIICRINITGTSTVFTGYPFFNGHTYNFFAYSTNTAGDGFKGNTTSATISLDAPSLNATPGKAKITVNWGAVPDADTYKVCWANANAPTSINCRMSITGTSTEFTGYPFFNGHTYNFFAYSTNTGGDSPQSATTSATLNLAAPSGLSLSRASNGHVTFNWGAVADADSYIVYRSPDGINGSGMGTVTVTSKVDTAPYSPETFYYVAATNAAGNSPLSYMISTLDGDETPHCTSPINGPLVFVKQWADGDSISVAAAGEVFVPRTNLFLYTFCRERSLSGLLRCNL